jgi:hypothetical protein
MRKKPEPTPESTIHFETEGELKSKNVGKKLVFYAVDDFDYKIKKISKI